MKKILQRGKLERKMTNRQPLKDLVGGGGDIYPGSKVHMCKGPEAGINVVFWQSCEKTRTLRYPHKVSCRWYVLSVTDGEANVLDRTSLSCLIPTPLSSCVVL